MKEKGNRVAAIGKLYQKFCGILLSLAVFVCAAEVVSRTLFGISYDFLYTGSIWLVIWSVLLLSGPVLKEGGHINIGFVVDKLKGRLRLSVEVFNSLCILIWGALIAWGGIKLVQLYHTRNMTFALYFPIPMWMVYLCVPLGMVIFTIYAVRQLGVTIFRR